MYEMYYAQAMNHKLYKENNPQANYWADKVEQTFKRDKDLCDDYNNVMSGGKWKNMMIQKHIGYTSWNDNFPADKQPEVYRIEEPENAVGGYVFKSSDGVVAMEAEHYFEKKDADEAQWTVIPYMGRTLSGMALMPYTKDVAGASLSYKMEIPKDITEVTVHIVVKSTLAFHDIKGHKYEVGFNGGNVETIGTKADGTPWRVGVQNPDPDTAQSYLHVVNLNDSCLVTSGTYQRYYEVDGVRYHHIINPDTLMPWDTYDSVSILCDDSARADALSTAVFNMDPEAGLGFVEAQEDVEALWVFPDGTEMQSSGFQAYMSQ